MQAENMMPAIPLMSPKPLQAATPSACELMGSLSHWLWGWWLPVTALGAGPSGVQPALVGLRGFPCLSRCLCSFTSVGMSCQSHNLTLFNDGTRHLCSWFLQRCHRQQRTCYTCEVIMTWDTDAEYVTASRYSGEVCGRLWQLYPGCSHGRVGFLPTGSKLQLAADGLKSLGLERSVLSHWRKC